MRQHPSRNLRGPAEAIGAAGMARRVAWLGMVAVVSLGPGCGSGVFVPRSDSPDGPAAASTRSAQPQSPTASAPAPRRALTPLGSGASIGTSELNIDELVQVVPLALASMEWTQVSIHSDEAALAITGITPADRPVEVRAQLRPAPQTGAAVQVSVGYFNDHHAQQALLQAIDDATTAWRLKQQRKAQR